MHGQNNIKSVNSLTSALTLHIAQSNKFQKHTAIFKL